MADLSALRQSYQSVLAEQLKKGMQGVQGLYAGRGTTGSGEEGVAMGELGRQYGLGTAQNELALQQFGEGQRQFDVGQGLAQQQFGLQSELGRGGLGLQQQQLAQQGQQFGQSLGEQQRQFNVGATGQFNGQDTLAKQLAAQQYGLAQGQLTGQFQGGPTQSYIQQMMPYITGGYMQNPFANLGGIQTEQQLSPEYQLSEQLRMNPYELALQSQLDPEAIKNRLNLLNSQRATQRVRAF